MSYANAPDPGAPGSARAKDLFDFWQGVAERSEWAEEPNRRRKGVSGVRRARLSGEEFFIKTQVDHCHYDLRHPRGRPTVLREAEALEACHRLGILAPQIVFCQARRVDGHHHALLVTRSIGNFVNLDDFLRLPEVADRRRRGVLEGVAATLSRLHGARWQHSAMYAKHIYVAQSPIRGGKGVGFDVALLDLEKARRRLSVKRASRHDISQLRRHVSGLDDRDWEHFIDRYAQLLGRRRTGILVQSPATRQRQRSQTGYQEKLQF